MPRPPRVPRLVSSFVVCCLVIPSVLLAQATGALVGTVRDATGRPLIGVSVSIVGGRVETTTDRLGEYRLSLVPVGSQTAVARFIGYAAARQTVEITAGAEPRVDFSLAEAARNLTEITVEGARLGQALALNQQKNAGNIRNVVDAELVGRLPDPNTADALQRLPGISIQRDQGEGRYVLIRGTQARLTNATINGIRVPAPDGDVRQVALDVIPSDQLASLEVSKTLTPDMDAEAVGGSINLVQRAPRTEQWQMLASVAGGYNRLSRDRIAQFSGTAGRRFGRFGVLVGGTFYDTRRASNNIEGPGEWTTLDGGEAFQEELEFRDYQVNRRRWGLNSTLEYTLDATSRFFLRGLYNEFGDDELRRQVIHGFGDGDVTPTSATSFDVTGFPIGRALRQRYEVQRIYSFQMGGEHRLPSASIDYTFALARASEREPTATAMAFEAEGFDATVDFADPRRPRIGYGAGSDPMDATAYAYDELSMGDNRTRDLDRSGAVNVTMPFRFGAGAGAVKIGALVRLKKKNRDNRESVFGDFQSGDLTLGDVDGGYRNSRFFFGDYEFGPTPGSSQVNATFGNDPAAAFELDENDTREADAANYDATEDVYAGYLMTRLEMGRLLLIPGARLEATRVRYTGNTVEYDLDGDYVATTPVEGRESYTQIFPSLNARFTVNENTNIRAAVTTSLARPNYYDLVPYSLAFREDEEVELGNPTLKPTRAVNLDLLAERYLSSVGVISGGVFYKRLTDFIYPRTITVESGPFAGFTGLQSANGEAATIWGAEFAVQSNFTFLPGWLSGFGANANYTYTKSTAIFPDRTTESRLPGQAMHSGNLALFYEDGRFQGRLAANYFGDYLDEVGEDADQDRFFDGQVQVDASASYRLTPQVRLFAEAVNLTDQPLRYYQGRASRPDQQEYYSRWGLMGFRFQF